MDEWIEPVCLSLIAIRSQFIFSVDQSCPGNLFSSPAAALRPKKEGKKPPGVLSPQSCLRFFTHTHTLILFLSLSLSFLFFSFSLLLPLLFSSPTLTHILIYTLSPAVPGVVPG